MRALKCEACGNVVTMVKDSGVTPVCCGKEMVEIKPEELIDIKCK